MPLNNLTFEHPSPNTLRLKLSGDWRICAGLPEAKDVFTELEKHTEINQINFDVSGVDKWDSGLISFLFHIIRECGHRKIQAGTQGLPEGISKLLALALKVREKDIPQKIENSCLLEKVGGKVLQESNGVLKVLNFLGDVAFSFGRLIVGKAYFRWDDFFGIVQRCGADALFLTSMSSILIGMILAFIGAIQLKLFGAQIYVADIVGIGMVRVMGAVMTGILLAGRTGASFAAQLGLMQVNEEIDALKTLGISPVEFLVTPRILALIIMMPLLTIYADFMGILGSFIISTTFLGLNPVEYLQHTKTAVHLNHLWVGLAHGFVFAIVVSISGCFCGMETERSAEGIGVATTSAVVNAITGIVISTAIITLVCQVLGV